MAIADLVFIDDRGFHAPDYPTVLDMLKEEYRTIYGADTYLEDDSQDDQWVAVMALAIFDLIQLEQATYNSFSPLTAGEDALARNVKLNGIRKAIATFSQVDLLIVGQVGTQITNGQASDTLEQNWLLPPLVTIPLAGEITVTATAEKKGNVPAAANSITKIKTPTNGWQTVNNPLAAIPGDPVETAAELRKRQTVSTALPSLSVLDGIIGAVASLDGVTRFRGYENDSNVTDADGIPGHSISIVVEGGDVQEIGDTIAVKKTPGTGTYGTTSVTTYDKYLIPNVINFFRPVVATIGVEVTLKALTGYTTGFADQIKAAVSDYINDMEIGDDIFTTDLYVPAKLPGATGATYYLVQIRIKKNAGAFSTANIVLAFNEIAICNPATDVTVIVT